MSETVNPDQPSKLFSRPIDNVSYHMSDLFAQIEMYPLRDMKAFNVIKDDFTDAENEAKLFCSKWDNAPNLESTDRAIQSTISLLGELIKLKNQAAHIIAKEPSDSIEYYRRAQKVFAKELAQLGTQYADILAHDKILGNDLQQLTSSIIASKP